MFVKLKNPQKYSTKKNENSWEDEIQKKITRLNLIKIIIRNIYDNKPAGLVHAHILSEIVKRPIRIWQNNQIIYVCGKKDGNKVMIEAEYNKDKNGFGHWSLLGGKDVTATSENGCLYEVVASQTGLNDLQSKAAIFIRRQSGLVAKALLVNKESLLGGARYAGTGPSNAQQVLDASQNGQCHPEGRSGHPRGHASHPISNRSDDTIESYSYSRWRSGFLSRADQDLVAHYTLVTNSALDLMEELNRGQQKVDRHIRHNELDYDPLPLAQIWSSGNKQGEPGNFQKVCLVGKHFLNQQNNAYADIFVLTFYPIL